MNFHTSQSTLKKKNVEKDLLSNNIHSGNAIQFHLIKHNQYFYLFTKNNFRV